MPLIHGQELAAAEFELTTSRAFDARRFAALCNAIAWSHCQGYTSIPSLTERVNVKDGGIDAEVHLPLDLAAPKFFLPGWNVSQYKLRDITTLDRGKILSHLRSSCRGALAELYSHWGHRPQRYLLFVNVDLVHEQKKSLRRAVLQGYDEPDQVAVDVVAAAELATAINALPHLRSAYFTEGRFQTWRLAWDQHLREIEATQAADLVGRDSSMAELRALLADEGVRGVILSGPSGIGKTRLALQSTEPLALHTVAALDANLTVSDLVRLKTPERTVIVLIDDLDPDTAEALLRAVTTESGLKLLITLPTEDNAPTPRLGMDARIRPLSLPPLSDTESSELLKKAGARFDYSVQSWVVREAGGIPLVLLLAAQNAEGLRATSHTFFRTIADQMEARLQRRLGGEAMDVLRLVSLLSRLGFRGSASGELEAVCKAIGAATPNAVLNQLPRLERAGVVRLRGSYLEVTPPFLANHLAETCLKGRFLTIENLLADFNAKAQKRFIARLRLLRSDEVDRFWRQLFIEGGLLESSESALHHVGLLQQIVDAAPVPTANRIHEALEGLAVEELLAIQGHERFQLVHLLEQLLFRKKTSRVALTCLARLAEAETDHQNSNSATGIFCEAYFPSHPQLPLPLHERADVLRSTALDSASVAMQLVGIRAAKAGLDWRAMNPLRDSYGPDPLDRQPDMTWGDVFDYTEILLSYLQRQAQSPTPEVSQAAREILPQALDGATDQLPPPRLIPFIEAVVEDALSGGVPVALAELMSALQRIGDAWTRSIDKEEMSVEMADGYKSAIERLRAVLSRLTEGDYGTRLRCQVGAWRYEEDEERLIDALVEEAVRAPTLLGQSRLAWLTSEEAKKGYIFFYSLGKQDVRMGFLLDMEALAREANGADAFASYCGGLAQHSPGFLNAYLDRLSLESEIAGVAVVCATRFDRGSSSVDRVIRLLGDERVNAQLTLSILIMGVWADSLTTGECLRFLRYMNEKDPTVALTIVDFLQLWSGRGHVIEGELQDFAWDCLRGAVQQLDGDRSNNQNEVLLDGLAARLTKRNIEEAFGFFDCYLRTQGQGRYGRLFPFFGRSMFWASLKEADHTRAVRALLDCLTEESNGRFYLPFACEEPFQQEEDREILVDYAMESKEKAGVVSQVITTAQPGFWQIATALLEAYPTDEDIKMHLTEGIHQHGRFVIGPYSSHLRSRLEEVERAIEKYSPTGVIGSWFTQIAEAIREEVEYRRRHEEDRDTNDF